ncbi:MAG: spermidine/putrescine transport system permease protein [Rhodospirillaceae bacterium]|jgi:spermidine/putrescine transport system permease protein|nr:spermidine/putrescine transport system permease protein [Rhodospirillaceae bacterium]
MADDALASPTVATGLSRRPKPKTYDLKRQPGFATVALLCLAMLYAPIIILVIFSFNASRSVTRWSSFSLDWYASVIGNGEIHDATRNSLTIAFVATVISTVLATAAALATARTRPWRGMKAAYMVVNLPLMVPEIVTAVATLSFFALLAAQFHLNLGIGNLILAHTVFCIPFAYMPIRARLEDMDLTLEQAAADLYAPPWRVFRRITLPLLMPGISAGAALALIVSFDDFTITQLVAGPGQTTLPLYIWGQLHKFGITPEVNAISSILLVVSILLVSLSFAIGSRRK